jgi:hypothetical protein
MRGRWVETIAERCFFILNKFLNRMRQELGSDLSLLPPKPAYAELQAWHRRSFDQSSPFVTDPHLNCSNRTACPPPLI